jgi:non-lysosomal glucosylceramidase
VPAANGTSSGGGGFGHYAAGSDGCTKGAGCTHQEGSFADAFYGQVLAYSLGLGELLARPDRLDEHLAYTAKANCVHNDPKTGDVVPGCPNGLVIMTERPVQLTDLQVWEMATYDHAVVALWRNSTAASTAALNLAQGTGTSYSDRINDQWNIAGIKMNDGYPSITSHYGYHMTSWHLVFALSRQQADLSNPSNGGSLTFDPLSFSFPCVKPGDKGYTLPFLLPNIVGTVSCTVTAAGAPQYAVDLTVGEVELAKLSVSGHSYPSAPVKLVVGAGVVWS